MNTVIAFTKNPTVINEAITITCASDGFPEPIYTIYHNDTVVGTNKTYTISQVKREDAGTYKCIANNTLGKDSDSFYLNVTEGGSQYMFLCTGKTNNFSNMENLFKKDFTALYVLVT